jgi:hypothetical protein
LKKICFYTEFENNIQNATGMAIGSIKYRKYPVVRFMRLACDLAIEEEDAGPLVEGQRLSSRLLGFS